MAWDKTLPTNATKIRNYPTVLTDNFSAVEEGDLTLKHWQVNFIERNAVPGAPPPAVDPTRADDTMIIFSKQNADGETDLYVLDDRSPANNFALTENGRLGGRGTEAVFQDLSIGTNTFVNDQNSFVWAYGTIPAGGGAVTGGVGLGTATISTVSGDANTYTVPLTRTPANANYIVIATCASSAAGGLSNNRIVNLRTGSKTTAQFQLRMQRNGSSTNRTDAPIQVMVIGGF